MAKKKKKKPGYSGFSEYYQSIYQDRWKNLEKSLLAEASHFELKEELQKSYFLDPASVKAAQCLDVQPGDLVLDLCAAPGGKTLVLAQALNGQGMLVSNEKSANRRGRLKKVLQEHLKEEWLSISEVRAHDACRWGLYEQDKYDKILLDAPCSSEQHLLKSPKDMEQWSPGRTRRLAQQQYAMLCSALIALKPGGRILYSTCSLSHEENDGVIQKLLEKKSKQFRILKTTEYGEETNYGRIILPDLNPGEGPIYFSLLEKL